MKPYILFLFMVFSFFTWAQKSSPIKVKWVKDLRGDYSFTNDWSYPFGVERKADGRAGCADGGFCPEKCYGMMDSNDIVLKEWTEEFYKLLDTTHLNHTIQCEAWCYEWAGADFLYAVQKSKDTVLCYTEVGIATHCSLELIFVKGICYATIDLNSIVDGGSARYNCNGGVIRVDEKLWKQGILKAEFSFDFEHKEDPKQPMFWKGKISSKIKT